MSLFKVQTYWIKTLSLSRVLKRQMCWGANGRATGKKEITMKLYDDKKARDSEENGPAKS
jgi:hypothetical protein